MRIFNNKHYYYYFVHKKKTQRKKINIQLKFHVFKKFKKPKILLLLLSLS